MDAVSRESREIFFPFPSIIREELFIFCNGLARLLHNFLDKDGHSRELK
jgi:hypothetical protein